MSFIYWIASILIVWFGVGIFTRGFAFYVIRSFCSELEDNDSPRVYDLDFKWSKQFLWVGPIGLVVLLYAMNQQQEDCKFGWKWK